MVNLVSAVVINAEAIDSVFSGVGKLWALVGPVVGALLGSWLTARNQRSGDRDRRRDDAARERATWNREKTEETFRDAMRAVSDHSRAASFVIWWSYIAARGIPVLESEREQATTTYNESARQIELAQAVLMLHDDDGAALVERARRQVKMKVEAVREHPAAAATATTPDEIEAVRNELVAFTSESLRAISDRARELLKVTAGVPA